jgi:hypothetical protein
MKKRLLRLGIRDSYGYIGYADRVFDRSSLVLAIPTQVEYSF